MDRLALVVPKTLSDAAGNKSREKLRLKLRK
jgi:hypothetical protein